MSVGTPPGPNPVLAATMARLALRQQNLGVLLPVLLHDVNGALNGVTLSAELLARLSSAGSEDAAGGATASGLAQRTRSELARLKQALKLMEQRVLPAGTPPRAGGESLIIPLRDAEAVLLPALRRGQHELRIASAEGGEPRAKVRPDDLFDLVAGLLMVSIEGAAPGTAIAVHLETTDSEALLVVVHGAAARAGLGLEIHRELLRQAASCAGGGAEWLQAGAEVRARLRLPLAAS